MPRRPVIVAANARGEEDDLENLQEDFEDEVYDDADAIGTHGDLAAVCCSW